MRGREQIPRLGPIRTAHNQELWDQACGTRTFSDPNSPRSGVNRFTTGAVLKDSGWDLEAKSLVVQAFHFDPSSPQDGVIPSLQGQWL